MEHHSNIVPWQMVCEQTGAKLRVAPIDERGELQLDEFAKLLTPRPGSSRSGTSRTRSAPSIRCRDDPAGTPAEAAILIDGAQAVPHLHLDVADLDCDFYAFSGHKVYGPTGIGALYGRVDCSMRCRPTRAVAR